MKNADCNLGGNEDYQEGGVVSAPDNLVWTPILTAKLSSSSSQIAFSQFVEKMVTTALSEANSWSCFNMNSS